MYKSSPLTPFLRYVFPVMITAIFTTVAIVMLSNNSTDEPVLFSRIFLGGVAWAILLVSQLPFRLRDITAKEDGLEISKKILVPYKDIEWTTRFHYTSPWFTSLKYYNKESDKHKIISFVPCKKDTIPFSDDAMTRYINEKIITENPNYSKENSPSKIKNILLLVALFIPSMALLVLI